MSYNVIATDYFQKEAKKLIRKYRSLRGELKALGEELADNPTTGTSLGHDLYKVRLAIASKGKGKSGGARVITCVKVVQEKVYLVSIYDKSQLENLSKQQIEQLLQKEGLG
ncbi:type II toxin-antitoxin system RelE/ParE family toxin [Tunicatimonas pelagia]|uniref:type II toxin-antitoxin system RelE/ParE family toxin n=1 Tax=Tunicatimonas pelagia TaxID=931531 RepID=UPI0026668F66|nr:type II toxin-antitoxin system RelE/ParE family toxin [Tunicatimonas pelagia]WKN45305.1 type II toxin-antitoxin system RelE/ParE family toxin [Tunicatimonas pelagia]WKN45314.1 type II toxin-antitoxin system RelE/ParE family toxin [Tunicatimonas pelagia]